MKEHKPEIQYIDGIPTYGIHEYTAIRTMYWRRKDSWWYDIMSKSKGRWMSLDDIVQIRHIGNSRPLKYIRIMAANHGYVVERSKKNNMIRFVRRMRLD